MNYYYLMLLLVILLLKTILWLPTVICFESIVKINNYDNYDDNSFSDVITSGNKLFQKGVTLFEAEDYDRAIPTLWKSILRYTSSDDEDGGSTAKAEGGNIPYTIQNAFLLFMQCFAQQGRLVDGYIYVAREYIQRGQESEARGYLDRAFEIDPANTDLLMLRRSLLPPPSHETAATSSNDGGGHNYYTPEQLHDIGVQYFNKKQFDVAAHYFEQSCRESQEQIGPACANAVFCRTEVLDWGTNGSQFDLDMERVERLTHTELRTYRYTTADGRTSWRRCTSVHPHMMLGYPLDAKLQRIVDEAYAATDELHARVTIDESTNKAYATPLPSDLPYNPKEFREEILNEILSLEAEPQHFRIRIGFVSSAIKQTAVMYLGHTILQFLNATKFEVHIFATSGPDHPAFIERTTNGVDWRQRVKDHVDYFHDVSHLQHNHIELARFVRQNKIHILIDWDGYARQGVRPQGLFALRPAPIQMFHQEFLGTSGANYVDYHVSDVYTSPPEKDYLYTEKLIYLPNHFFSKGHAVMPEIAPPRLKYDKAIIPYKTGTGSPQENRCLSRPINNTDVSFVFCNFHKFLKVSFMR